MTDLASINVDELEAGEQTDLLVGEFVCGWKWAPWPLADGSVKALVAPDGIWYALWLDGEPGPSIFAPKFSSDFVACMPLAVEAKLLMTPTSDSWYASEWLANGLHAEAPTLPLAICKCLLKMAQAKARGQ
jgi:hypothetical protein